MDTDVANDAARETICKNYSKLGSKINVEDILPRLFSKRIIGDYERKEIRAGKTQLQRSQTLVDCLLRKSGKQFEQFCSILEGTRVFTEFARSLRSQYDKEKALIQRRRGRRVGKQPVEEQASLPPQKTAAPSSGQEALPQYDSLTVDQCDSIVNRLQSSLQIVDMPVIAQALNVDKILTPEEFSRLQDNSHPNRHRWLLAALRRTRMIGLKSFHRALESTSRTAPQHMEVLSVLVDRVEAVTGVKITLTESSSQSDVPLMKLLQPPETTSPSGSGGKPQEIGQISIHLESSKESVQAPQPPPSGQKPLQPRHPPSIHHSTPAPVSLLSSVGLGAGASGRDQRQQEGLGMSEGRLPQSQLAAPQHGRPTTGQQLKEAGDVSVEGKLQPTSLPGRQSLSPRPKRSRFGNGSKLDVINTTLLKACMDGNEGNIETIVNISRPELNVACVGEAGLSPLHYAVKKKLRRGLATMVQHSSFTLGVTDKDGQTPLHYAAKDGDKELLQLLNHSSSAGGDSELEYFSPQNMQDRDGNTALHLGVEGGHFDIVKSLVAVFNCSLLIKNNKRLRPVHLAADKGNNDIVKYLMRHEHPPDEDTLSNFSIHSECGRDENSVLIRRDMSEMEDTSGSRDKALMSTEQENGSSWGSSELSVKPEAEKVGSAFTEADCSRLYHKAMRDNPTITLHIAKAMTIGPPQVGKTSLFYHLLGLPTPDEGSTPVMNTAETVSVCPSESTASPDEINHFLFSGSVLCNNHSSDSDDTADTSSDDSDDDVGQSVVKRSDYKARMCVVDKNKWVLVSNSSGLLSLLTFLRQKMDAFVTRPRSSSAPVEVDSESLLPEAKAVVRDETDIPPLDDRSDTAAVMISQMYPELQNPEIANVTLADVHLLQFLDSGGQLAYHDILPIFVNIPAIYLHVFNVTKDLTEYPIDELCSVGGKKKSSSKSALSTADMITRSVMTVHSLADRKVQLPSEVKCESKSPKSHIVLVGTHLDLVEGDSEAKLKAVNEMLRKTLQLKSRCLEGMVLKSEKPHRMFFPVNTKVYVEEGHQLHKHCKCKHCHATKHLKRRLTKQAMADAVKVEVPVRWYLHQLLELSQDAEKPLYSYSELFQRCKEEGSVVDVGEFHAMVTYFHTLGLLLHLCGADVRHTEDSDCLVFTNPSYLFKNISKMYQVQFEEEVEGEGKILLKHECKLTKEAIWDLEVQLNADQFMDLLVQLFIGAEVKSHKGDRILFVPSVLTNSPDDETPSEVGTKSQEQSLCFALTFEGRLFIPCGVFTGMIARLQSTPGWEIYTRSVSRLCMQFAVGALATVTLFDHATHISVNMDHLAGPYRQYRDTIIQATADSYCFLFHSKTAKDSRSGTCSVCMESPYLVLGQTCLKCPTCPSAPEAPHFAELKVEHRLPVSVRCHKTLEPKPLSDRVSVLDLFRNMSHYAVIKEQHTRSSLEGEGGVPPSQPVSQITSGPCSHADHDLTISKPKEKQSGSIVGHVLEHFWTRFTEDVDAKAIAFSLKHEGIINDSAITTIQQSNDARSNGQYLHDYLMRTCDKESLVKVCDIIIAVQGNPKMKSLGKDMKDMLENP